MSMFIRKQLSKPAWALSMGKWSTLVVVRVERLVEVFVKPGQWFLPAWPVSMAFAHGWVNLTAIAWGLLVLAGFRSESSSEFPALDMVSTSGRMMEGAFLRSKPTALSNSGLMISKEVTARRVVETHLAWICFSFLMASNASDVLQKSNSSCKVRHDTVNLPMWGGLLLRNWGWS